MSFRVAVIPGNEETGRRLDLDLARQQVGLVVDQLRGEGRDIAADIVQDLSSHVAELARDLEEVRADLAAQTRKPGRVKTSGGKDHASARGTISSGGKAVHGNYGPEASVAGRGIAPPKAKVAAEHKHRFNPSPSSSSFNKCVVWNEAKGGICGALRQRKARAPKQTSIPGTDGAAKGSEATP